MPLSIARPAPLRSALLARSTLPGSLPFITLRSGTLSALTSSSRRYLTSERPSDMSVNVSTAHLLRPRISSQVCACQRRTFFSLNDLAKVAGSAGAAKGKGGATQYSDRKQLPYTPAELYAIVSDVDSYDRFLPFCVGSRVLGPAPEASQEGTPSSASQGEATRRVHAELTVGFKSFRESYTSLVEMREGQWVSARALPHPLFKTLVTRWEFVPLEAGQTRIDFHLEYAFASPLYGAMAGGIFQELSARMMVAFEQRAKEVYGVR